MALTCAPRGLIGVLAPQANTTVEPELALLLPRGFAMLNARLTSAQQTIEARLLDHLRDLEPSLAQFANAPLAAFAFACAGASYLAGPEQEDALVARIEAVRGVPMVTAARAVCDAFAVLGARRIGLVSPYPPALTEAAARSWRARGFEVVRIAGAEQPEGAFHPIYAMTATTAQGALETLQPAGLDAVVMLGTGMPTLAPIASHPRRGEAPVLSCLLALGWRSVLAAEGRAPDREGLLGWIAGGAWRARL
jgi:maleate cis-trans isomerase